MQQRIENILNKRKEQNTYRTLTNKTHLIDFCSNDYLGLAQSSPLHEQILKHIKTNSVNRLGATGSRLISGNYEAINELEKYLAHFFNAESSLLFNSGYTANIGLISTVARKTDLIVYDELIHASLHDGIRLSQATSVQFNHNDLVDLESKLKPNGYQQKFVIIESIYSMDGDVCPLPKIVEICKKHNAHIILDEAHSTGLYDRGKGLACHLKLENQIFARTLTFGKAIGYHGAIVAGSEILIDYLINYSRPFIYTTAPPYHFVNTLKVIFQYLIDNQQNYYQQLIKNIKYFNEQAKHLNLKVNSNATAIQTLIIGNAQKAIQISAFIEKKGFYAKAIVSPTVAKGTERLRICLHAFNTKQQISNLLVSVKEAMNLH